MADELTVGDILRTTLNFELGDGTQYQNVYHHIVDGIGGFTDQAAVNDLTTWANTMYGEIDSSVKDDVIPKLSFVDQVEFVDGAWQVVANIGTLTMTFTGGSAGEVCPNQVSPFIVMKTARPKSVGRKFLFPTLEADQDAGILTAGTVTKIVAFAADAIADVDIDVVNTLHAGVPRTGVNDWLNFTVAVVTNLVGTQRRRRPGYGA